MLQKTGAADFINEHRTLALNNGGKDTTDPRACGGITRIARSKRCEIMLSLEKRSRLTHRGLIERVRMVSNIVSLKRRTNFFAENPVAIELSLRVEAGVELGLHLRNR